MNKIVRNRLLGLVMLSACAYLCFSFFSCETLTEDSLAAKVGVVENFERRAAARRSGPVFAIKLEEFEENFHVPSMDAIPKQRFLEALGSNDVSVKVLAENQVRKNRLTGERFSIVYSITVNGSEYLKLSDMNSD